MNVFSFSAWFSFKLYTAVLKIKKTGTGNRTIVAEGVSPTTGPYIVEDAETSVGNQNCKVRRLYFTSNTNVIQSESYLDSDGNVDRQKLAFEYHWQLCAGLLLTTDIVVSSSTTANVLESKNDSKALVVGLGGACVIYFCDDRTSIIYCNSFKAYFIKKDVIISFGLNIILFMFLYQAVAC